MDFKLHREKERLKEYELAVQEEEGKETTALGYRDMNTRFLNMEETEYGVNWEEKKKEHQTRKEALEKKWHKVTEARKKELDKAANKNFSDKEKGYYDNFTLKEMEVFLKNSDRGGNSDEFNSVATDLELYNVISEQGDTYELISLLTRLKESCDAYLSSRTSPGTPKGKRRRAMIQQVSEKTERLLNETYGSVTQDVKKSYDAFAEHKNDENTEEKKALIETACKAQFNQIFQDLSDNKDLSVEERQAADARMQEIVMSLQEQDVEGNQSPNLSSKFFNAIGWSDRKPKLCQGFSEKDMKRSPIKVPMYHSMNTYKDIKDCKGLAEQLKGKQEGKSRQYYSAGNYGKGTYTAVRNAYLADKTDEEKQEIDKKASNHSWDFGKNIGSVQLTMMLNENARVVDYNRALDLVKKFQKMYPKTYEAFKAEIKEGYRGAMEPALTAILAFFGYNTLRFPGGCGFTIDYYITTDRKAFSIDVSDQRIREKEGIENY